MPRGGDFAREPLGGEKGGVLFSKERKGKKKKKRKCEGHVRRKGTPNVRPPGFVYGGRSPQERSLTTAPQKDPTWPRPKKTGFMTLGRGKKKKPLFKAAKGGEREGGGATNFK